MTRIADVVEMTFGFAFKSAEFSEAADDVRLLRGDNIAQGRLRWNGVKRFPAYRVDEVGRYQLAVGDVVVAMDRPWIEAGLKYSVVREEDVPSLLVQRVARLRTKSDSLDQGFLGLLIGSAAFTNYVIGVQTGSAVPHISGRQIGDFEFVLPPIEVQRAIAATLGALDGKIESNMRLVTLVSDLIDTHSEKHGAGLPTVPLGDIAAPVKESLNPSKLGDTQVDHYSLPAFDRDARPERVAASSIMSNKLKVPKQAILLSRLNPRFNRTWWAAALSELPALASTEFLVLTAEDEQRLAAVWLALRDPFFRGEIPKRVTGTSGSHQRVKPDDVLAIEVPDFTSAPTVLKESALAMLKRSESLRAESARLSALRDALLPELLSGRLRASVGTL